MKKIIFDVEGMHCPSCEILVTEELNDLEGVQSSSADHKKGMVIIEFDESSVSIDDLKKIIKEEGYKVK
jgi:copper chaperone CopZ